MGSYASPMHFCDTKCTWRKHCGSNYLADRTGLDHEWTLCPSVATEKQNFGVPSQWVSHGRGPFMVHSRPVPELGSTAKLPAKGRVNISREWWRLIKVLKTCLKVLKHASPKLHEEQAFCFGRSQGGSNLFVRLPGLTIDIDLQCVCVSLFTSRLNQA